MAQVYEVIEGPRGMMVKLGLGSPGARAITSAALAATVAYAVGFPASSFNKDKSLKYWSLVKPGPDSTHAHFLVVPLVVGTAVFLFT